MELNISPNVYELQIGISFFFSETGAQGLTLSSSSLKSQSADAALTNYLRLPSLAHAEVLTNSNELICRLCSNTPIGYEFH